MPLDANAMLEIMERQRLRIAQLQDALKSLGTSAECEDEELPPGSRLVLAPINVEQCRIWANRLGTRSLARGDVTWCELLEGFIGRARKIEGRSGHWVEDVFVEARISEKLGFKQNLEVRAHGGAVSAFAAPKGIRYIVRCGVPDIHVVDVVNSHLVHLLRDLSPEERLLGVAELEEIVDQRETVFRSLEEELNQCDGRPALTRTDIKTLILGIAYGGSFANLCWGRKCPEWITRFGVAVRRIADFRAGKSPELIRMLEAEGRRDPAISLLSHQVTLAQRKTVDAIAALIPRERHVSYERDGFAYWSAGLSDEPSLHDFEEVAGMPL